MAETTTPRRYRVLTAPGPDAAVEFQGIHRDLGIHEADRAERAVEMAVDADVRAGAATGAVERCIAVPIGNWTECTVEEDPRPRFKARRVSVEAPAGEPADPEPASE
jgi:hypothetical protein